MAKQFLTIFAVVLTAFLAAAPVDEKNLLSLVPANPDAVLSVDTAEWINVAAVKKEIAKSSDVKKITSTTGLKIEDLKALVFWMKGTNMALLTAWNKTFAPEKIFKAPLFSCTRSKVRGTELYNIKYLESLPVRKKSRHALKKKGFSCWIALLPGNNVGFFATADTAVNALAQMKRKGNFRFPAKLDGSLRAVAGGTWVYPCLGIELGCRMTGKDKQDLSFVLAGTFNTVEEAAAMRNQAMLMCNLLLMQVFQKKPELVPMVLNCLKFDAAGKTVSVSALIPKQILTVLGKEAADMADNKKARRKQRKKAAEKKTGVKAL